MELVEKTKVIAITAAKHRRRKWPAQERRRSGSWSSCALRDYERPDKGVDRAPERNVSHKPIQCPQESAGPGSRDGRLIHVLVARGYNPWLGLRSGVGGVAHK